MKFENIVILTPTSLEASRFSCHFDCIAAAPSDISTVWQQDRVPVVHSGVGMAQTALTLAQLLKNSKPDILIMAGIAGVYPHSPKKVCDSVLISSENVADLGAYRSGSFTPLFEMEYRCSLASEVDIFPSVHSNTVSCACTPFSDGSNDRTAQRRAEIENMEGAVFFSFCSGSGIPFLEIRTISNITTDERKDWRIDDAVEQLARSVKILLDEITA